MMLTKRIVRIVSLLVITMVAWSASQAATSVSLRELASSIMVSGKSYGYLPDHITGEFTITSTLTGVYVIGNDTLVARDSEQCAPQWYSHPDNAKWAKDFVGSFREYDDVSNFAQNNWVLIKMPSGKNAADYLNTTFSNVTGTVDVSNTFDIVIEATGVGNPTVVNGVTPPLNKYTMANFNYEDGVYCNRNLWNEAVPTFFVVPKPGEVAKITFVYYSDATTVETPVNTPYKGAGTVDLSLLQSGSMAVGEVVDMIALITTIGEENDGVIQASPRRPKDVTDLPVIFQHDFDFNGYKIYPLEIKEKIPTAISKVDTKAEPVGVSYYNLAGVASREPFTGVNIVVTTMSDGSRQSEKRVY